MLKKKQQEQAANNLKTPEQLQFESHWSAGPSHEKSSQPQQPQPSTSRAVPVIQMSEKHDSYDDCQSDNFKDDENFDFRNEMPKNINRVYQDNNSKEGGNFECKRVNHGAPDLSFPKLPQGIPGLDYTESPNEMFKNRYDQVVNLEEDDKFQEMEEEYVPPKDPPPLPTFKSVVAKRVLVPIDDILDVPGRNNRPERLATSILLVQNFSYAFSLIADY